MGSYPPLLAFSFSISLSHYLTLSLYLFISSPPLSQTTFPPRLQQLLSLSSQQSTVSSTTPPTKSYSEITSTSLLLSRHQLVRAYVLIGIAWFSTFFLFILPYFCVFLFSFLILIFGFIFSGLVVTVLRNTEDMTFAGVEKAIAHYGKKVHHFYIFSLFFLHSSFL